MSTPKKKTPAVSISKCVIGQKVRLRSGKIATLEKVVTDYVYPYLMRHRDGGQTSNRKNGRYWKSGRDSKDDIVAFLPLPPKKAAKAKPSTLRAEQQKIIRRVLKLLKGLL